MSENMIRLVLLLIGSVIILAILWDGLRRKKDRHAEIRQAEDLFNQFDFLAKESENKEPIFDDIEEDLENTIDENTTDEDDESDQELNTEEVSDEEDTAEEELPPPVVEEAIVETNDMHTDDDVVLVDATPVKENEVEKIEEVEEEHIPQITLKIEAPVQKKTMPEFVSIRVVGLKNRTFAGYPLLRAILANRLDFGEKKLFHRYADKAKKQRLFSLASLSEPGDFDLYTMGDYVCDGLILYMTPHDLADPRGVFQEMLKTAQSLAKTLKGCLMSTSEDFWTGETTVQIENSLS